MRTAFIVVLVQIMAGFVHREYPRRFRTTQSETWDASIDRLGCRLARAHTGPGRTAGQAGQSLRG